MSVEHNGTFVINDVVLTIPPEQINIQTQASHKEWKPMRIRAPIKAKSGHSVIAVTLSVPFIGIEDINNKLRTLIAQFRLTPFCYVENQHLRNAILGGGIQNGAEAEVRDLSNKNMALALQNLTVSTIPDEPCALQANFSFLWFNYLPFTPDFYFKNHPTQRSVSGTPGKLWKIFYQSELAKLGRVTLNNSSLYMLTNEYLLKNPDLAEEIVDSKVKLQEIQEFAGDLDEFRNLLADTEAFDSEDGQPEKPGMLSQLSLLVTHFQDTNNTDRFHQSAFDAVVDAVDEVIKEAEKIQGSTGQISERKLTQILRARDNLYLKSTAGTGLWLKFPRSLLGGENKLSAVNNKKILEFPNQEASLYYRGRELKSHSDLIVEQVSVSLSHNLSIIPMAGHQYPTIQYMGGMDIRMDMRIKAMSDAALTESTTFWNIHHNNILNAKQFPRQYNNVYCNNEILGMFGVDQVILENKETDTIPGNPGTYDMAVGLCEAGIRPEGIEGLKSIPVGRHTARKMVWRIIFEVLNSDTEDLANREFTTNLLDNDFELKSNGSAALSAKEEGLGKGIGYHVDQIYDEMVRRSGHSKTLLGSFNRVSMLEQFNEILTLTDDSVYGVEGIQTRLWNKMDSNKDRLFGPHGQDAKSYFADGLEVYKKRQDAKASALPEQPAITLAEENNEVAKDLNTITYALKLVERGAKIDENFVITDPTNGKRLRLGYELSAVTVEKVRRIAVDQLAPGDEAAAGRLNEESVLNLLADARDTGNFQPAVVTALETLSDHIRQINTGEDPYDSSSDAVKKYFRAWNEFSLRNAEFIIEGSWINMSMFEKVRKLLELAEADSFGRVYRDFPLPDIRGNLENEFPHIDFNDGYTVEPDMYFYNHTPDNGLENLVPVEDINALRAATRRYSENVYEQNTTWFKQEYIKRMKGGMEKFLKSQEGASEAFLQIAGSVTEPATKSSIHKIKLDEVPRHSINNSWTDSYDSSKSLLGTPMLHKRGTTTETSPNGIIAEQKDSAETALGGDRPVIIGSAEQAEASDMWVHPLPGNTYIISFPGFRKRYGRFHQGMDIVWHGGSDVTWNKPVVAAAAGTVLQVYTNPNDTKGGIRVSIISDYQGRKLVHLYMHLNAVSNTLVRNSKVKQGEILGYCGNTGLKQAGKANTHLHFEVREIGRDNVRIYPFGTYKWDTDIAPNIGYRDIRTWKQVEQEPLIAFGDNNAHLVVHGPNDTGFDASRGTIEHAIDHLRKDTIMNTGLRMNRAYPGLLFSLIEEDAGDAVFRYDDFFNYGSIVSMDIVRDREVAADLCVIELTNISGILSNRKWSGTYLEDKAVYEGREQRENPDTLHTDDAKENPLDSLMLREGIKVELRLGYSDEAANLEPVLIGRIVGVQFTESDDLVRIEIQSLATELVQDLKGLQGDERNGIFFSDGNTAPLLVDMISSPEVVSFGFWKRGNRDTNPNRDLLTDRFEWNPNPAADNIFAPSSINLDPGSWTDVRNFLGNGVTKFFAGALGFVGGPLGSAAAIATLNIFKAGLDKTVGVVSGLTYFIWQTTIWDIFKEMELRHPEYIASPVPYYETNKSTPRMTMFFGRPDFLYFARDPSSSENAKARAIAKQIRQQKTRQAQVDIDANREKFGTGSDYAGQIVEGAGGGLRVHIVDKKAAADASKRREKKAAESEEAEKFIENFRQATALANGTIQPFRKYHVLTSRHHIVSNSIRARSSSTFNAATILYTDGNDSKVEIDNNNGPEITDLGQVTLKLDPGIPDEFIRENVAVFPNCFGPISATNYATSMLSKGVWQIYNGELVILGNPSIKPYDICYIFDDYSDMYGPIQVRRVQHIVSNETGFLTIITPDCINTISEGLSATTNQAMALASEVLLKRLYRVAAGSDAGDWSFVTTGANPNDGVQITPLGHLLGVSAGRFIGFFGGKRYLFRQQNSYPIRVQPLIHHGRPMVAGFGPGHVMKNEFSIFDSGTWKPALTGLVEQGEQWAKSFKDGIVTPRGRYGRSQWLSGVKDFTKE